MMSFAFRGKQSSVEHLLFHCRRHVHFLPHVSLLAVVQYHATKADLRCQVRRREWLRTGDDKVERGLALRRKAGLVLADDPLG